jgi:hypothetical protein
MSFPTTEVINKWFQDAHTTAVAAGGSVYVMEKRAEQEIVKDVLKWACLTMLDELEDLNYPANSRVRIRVVEMLTVLYDMTPATNEDDEPVDDYIDDEDEDESEEPSIEVDTDLAIEIVGALLKAITSK